MRHRKLLLAALVSMLLAAACSTADDPTSGPEIVIGSFGFGESEILGEIYAQGLAAEGYPVRHIAQIGPREIVKPQLESGEIGLVPEYVGSALEVGFGLAPGSDGERARDELAEAYAPAGISVLELAPVTVTNAFVVTDATAAEYGLSTISDLAELGTVRLGGPPECPERPRCMIGLETLYELSVEFTTLDAGGRLTIDALQAGNIDVGLFFSTFVFDPSLVQLDDDKRLQPAENVVPVVRTELLDAHGADLADRINEISAKITVIGLTELNRQFTVERRDAAEIAAGWLAEMSLVQP